MARLRLGHCGFIVKFHSVDRGDYITATPTFSLLDVKALPEFRKLFEDVFFPWPLSGDSHSTICLF